MKNIKKLIAVSTAVLVIGAAGMVYAADIQTPAAIVSALTGKSITEVTKERADGKTYATIANEADKLDEFKTEMLEQKKAILDQRVKNGQITQQQADEIYSALKNNQANCNGTGSAGIGRKNGVGFGRGNGAGGGCGMRGGNGLNAGGSCGNGNIE